MKEKPIVLIDWDDSCWTSRQFSDGDSPDDNMRLRTVGHMVKESKKSLCLAQEMDEDSGFRHVVSIPKSLIRRRLVLKYGKKKRKGK